MDVAIGTVVATHITRQNKRRAATRRGMGVAIARVPMPN